MIYIDINPKNGRLTCVVNTEGRCTVYLDNFAIIGLAKGEPGRRERFVTAIRNSGSLLFSMANAIEIAGPKGASADAVRAFLDSIGCHWVPLELRPWEVTRKEAAGDILGAPISGEFVNAYFQQRAYELSPGGKKLLDLSADKFFRLSSVVDWVKKQTMVDPLTGAEKPKVLIDAANIDKNLRKLIASARTECDKDTSLLDQIYPETPFDSKCPATFAMANLMRMLVKEAKAFQLKKNDGLDFCHAILGASAAIIATLDKQWKRRIENLPKPNGLARMFYEPELSDLVDLLEISVAKLNSSTV